MNISFQDKVALVTGAASGLGLVTAKAFAESGASVALADWNEDAVRAAAQGLTAQGHKAIAIRCDVADDAQVDAMVKQTVANFGRLDAAYKTLASRTFSQRLQTLPERITTASWGSISAANGAA